MTFIVIDASVALAWVLATQQTPAALALRTVANTQFVTPFVFAYEVRNALRKAERQQRISYELVDQSLLEFETVLEVVAPPDASQLAATLDIARAADLSFYDANYVELAMRLNCTLATRDGPILQAAPRLGVIAYDAR